MCRNESGIINLDNADGPDTHWVAYAKRADAVYFSSITERIGEIFEHNANRVQSHALSTLRSK